MSKHLAKSDRSRYSVVFFFGIFLYKLLFNKVLIILFILVSGRESALSSPEV